MTLDMNNWLNAYLKIRDMDSDHSGDLDASELHQSYDFASTDQNGDGLVTDVELYHAIVAFARQGQLVEKARKDLGSLYGALKQYATQIGSYPTTLQALWERPSDVSKEIWVPNLVSPIEVDPWGTPYQYRIEGPMIQIRSFGPDRQESTEDDIVSLTKKQ
jgi:hypothetical protein